LGIQERELTKTKRPQYQHSLRELNAQLVKAWAVYWNYYVPNKKAHNQVFDSTDPAVEDKISKGHAMVPRLRAEVRATGRRRNGMYSAKRNLCLAVTN
jgi:hypothetical protein